MTDKKLTDEEIIKNLKFCEDCSANINIDIIDLINRQKLELENLKVENQSLRGAANSLKMHYEEAQAEIERLNKVYQANQQLINALNKSYFLAKTEAYKEFAKRLKEFMHNKFKALDEYEFEYITERDINNFIKERLGENNDL